jgi:hypothetical protein
VLLHGGARRLPGRTGPASWCSRLEVAAVRVGSPPVLVDQSAWSAARPDPLRCDAPAVLAHLNEGHADALSAPACAPAATTSPSPRRPASTPVGSNGTRCDDGTTRPVALPTPVAALASCRRAWPGAAPRLRLAALRAAPHA